MIQKVSFKGFGSIEQGVSSIFQRGALWDQNGKKWIWLTGSIVSIQPKNLKYLRQKPTKYNTTFWLISDT